MSATISSLNNTQPTGAASRGPPPHPLHAKSTELNQPVQIALGGRKDFVASTIPVKNHNMVKNTAAIEIAELRDALAYAEYLLTKNMQEKEELLKTNTAHAFEMSKVEDQLKNTADGKRKAEGVINQMNQKFKVAEEQQKTMQGQVKDRLTLLQREISFRENEIGKMKNEISDKEGTISKVSVSDQLNQEGKRNLQTQLLAKNVEAQRIQEELDDTRKQLDTAIMTRKAEGTAQLQCEAFRQENARLLGLLAQTSEFSKFGEFAQDSGSGVRYMNPLPEAHRAERECHYPKKKEATKSFKADEEIEDWIPEEAYKAAHDFRNKCTANVSESLMNTLLHDLNKIWRARETKQISRIKSDSNRELEHLRRAVAFKKPYAQVMHEQEIKRLKKELADSQQALRENVAVIKQERDGPNVGLSLVDQTVRYTNQIQIERRELVLENEKLKQQVLVLQSSKTSADKEREKFFEGASWAVKQSVNLADAGISQSDKVRSEYHQRLNECNDDHFMRLRAAEWLIDSTQRIVKDVRNGSHQVLEDSLRSQCNAQLLLNTK